MIADIEDVEGAVGTIEQARSVKPLADDLRQRRLAVARKIAIERRPHARETCLAQRHAHDIGRPEHVARMIRQTDDMQHGRIAGIEQRAERKPHVERRDRRHRGIELLLAEPDLDERIGCEPFA